uniref:Uncharacterized protein n=1 Tax=Heterorhabditis bacteriophora TaxID=37862 RepID=A0A1I7WHB9_HETBA
MVWGTFSGMGLIYLLRTLIVVVFCHKHIF